MIKLSLCMIVKNEGAFLEQCLQESRKFVDQIIVIDTGSTDNTMAIAYKYADIIKEKEWEDDFAAARNASIKDATGDWIIFLDADELLPADDGYRLKEVLDSQDFHSIDGILVTIHSYLKEKGGDAAETNQSIRVFRNLPPIHFEGRIHEQVKGLKTITKLPLVIYHYGYLPEKMSEKDKNERNRLLILKGLADEPDNNYYRYHLGIISYMQEKHSEALEIFRDLLKKVKGDEVFLPRIYKIMALCYLHTKQYEELHKTVKEGKKGWSDFTDYYYIDALAYKEQGRYTEALGELRICLEMGDSKEYDSHQGVGSYLALQVIAEIAVELGNFQLCQNCLEKLVEHRPQNIDFQLLYIDTLMKNNKEEDAKQNLEYFVKVWNRNNSSILDQFVEDLIYLGHYSLVYYLDNNIEPGLNFSYKTKFKIACASFYLGQWVSCLRSLQAIKKNCPFKEQLLRFCFYCTWLNGEKENSATIVNEMLKTCQPPAPQILEAFYYRIQGTRVGISRSIAIYGQEKVKTVIMDMLLELAPSRRIGLLNEIAYFVKEISIPVEELLDLFSNLLIPESLIEYCQQCGELTLPYRYKRFKVLARYKEQKDILDFLIKEGEEILRKGVRGIQLYRILAQCYQSKAQEIRRNSQ